MAGDFLVVFEIFTRSSGVIRSAAVNHLTVSPRHRGELWGIHHSAQFPELLGGLPSPRPPFWWLLRGESERVRALERVGAHERVRSRERVSARERVRARESVRARERVRASERVRE